MTKKEKNEELQSRREFLKKTAKGALPILGISLFGPSILTSCEKEHDDDEKKNGGGGGSSNGCGKSCSGSCSSGCSGSCEDSCSGNCDGCTGGCFTTACTAM